DCCLTRYISPGHQYRNINTFLLTCRQTWNGLITAPRTHHLQFKVRGQLYIDKEVQLFKIEVDALINIWKIVFYNLGFDSTILQILGHEFKDLLFVMMHLQLF